ncbi:DUF1192 domain-containing protein [Sneathiella glossodoripedis]|uniref:DUF1192 domain-containing protein n=1 Tax=Sneathiella glossodoripedis TaxID=418853 RepID=UPI00046E9FEA|nr:DUF1192 domain-containing protein [Sneathiella glossodoripedis]
MASEEDDFPILHHEGRSFSDMSVEELQEYVAELRDEIKNVENIIKKKQSAQASAEQFFKN